MEINTEVQIAAILRGGEITYYDAAGEQRATGARSDFARQGDLWKHDGCVKAGFCNSEFEGLMFTAGADGAVAAVKLHPRLIPAFAHFGEAGSEKR